MLDDRKIAILKTIVNEYIDTAQPVGSAHVARVADVTVSSATIRNEMAVLEQEGYLIQPHTSAGRVPTDKGYRAYVDTMAGPGRLDAAQAMEVRSFFESSYGAIERMLSDTTKLLSHLTNAAAVVVGPGLDAATLRSVQLVALGARHLTVVAVLSNGAVEHTQVETVGDLDDARVSAATAHLSRALIGAALRSLPSELPATGDEELDRLCRTTVDALREITVNDSAQVFLGGATQMATSFDAVEVVRTVLATLEQQYVVVSLVRDVLDRGLSVAIGSEHGVEPLAACSVVVAPYMVEGERIGSVGVLGPTRMNYPQALAAVEIVSERLGRRLGEG